MRGKWQEERGQKKRIGRQNVLEENREKEFQGAMRSLRDKVYRDGTGHCEQFRVKGVGVIFLLLKGVEGWSL